MKALIPILISLLIVGCGKEQSTNTNYGNNTPIKTGKKKVGGKTPSKSDGINESVPEEASENGTSKTKPTRSLAEQKRVNQIKSASSLSFIGKFFQEYRGTLKVRQWSDEVFKDNPSWKMFLSPQLPQTAELMALTSQPKGKRISHYALNKTMVEEGFALLLFFECDLGWNGVGGLEDALKYMDKYKLEKIAVAFFSGSTKLLTKEELKELEW